MIVSLEVKFEWGDREVDNRHSASRGRSVWDERHTSRVRVSHVIWHMSHVTCHNSIAAVQKVQTFITPFMHMSEWESQRNPNLTSDLSDGGTPLRVRENTHSLLSNVLPPTLAQYHGDQREVGRCVMTVVRYHWIYHISVLSGLPGNTKNLPYPPPICLAYFSCRQD